ncbi:2-hydroxyacid dehydrogenase [Limimaricola hongkongensis]|uniref:D-3-phosphoglycerate dehydrogenase n=1 Tax=Limimaricola hongkongensis DSM 17492 TaxID=1122180 RepID=A0A017H7W7_9RHOB|nr:2-hydroxyacid dehydrogenase [Limimaricola hongkongensis]EYD70466.1 D-3-phosphoglycerate dehydrogenase [Limimaricola hongkongensis DSM 17492]
MTGILAIGQYNDTDLAALRAMGAVQVADLDALRAMGQGARAGLRAVAYKGHDGFGAAEMALLPDLGLIANYGVGVDAIDLDAARAAGVRVSNTPDVLNDDVADLAVALLLMQQRRLIAGDALVRGGDWAAGAAPGLFRKVSGRRAGILGLGRIGREIADRLAAFKMEIHYQSRSAKETPGWTRHEDAVSLAAAVDYLFVALVGGAETENAVSAEAIDALGPDGVLINISRGSVVDEAALLDALETGRLGGAGLDVFHGEPDVNPRFAALEQVVLQPHQGSATRETRAAMGQLQRDNIAAHLAGQALPSPVG